MCGCVYQDSFGYKDRTQCRQTQQKKKGMWSWLGSSVVHVTEEANEALRLDILISFPFWASVSSRGEGGLMLGLPLPTGLTWVPCRPFICWLL